MTLPEIEIKNQIWADSPIEGLIISDCTCQEPTEHFSPTQFAYPQVVPLDYRDTTQAGWRERVDLLLILRDHSKIQSIFLGAESLGNLSKTFGFCDPTFGRTYWNTTAYHEVPALCWYKVFIAGCGRKTKCLTQHHRNDCFEHQSFQGPEGWLNAIILPGWNRETGSNSWYQQNQAPLISSWFVGPAYRQPNPGKIPVQVEHQHIDDARLVKC